MQKGKIDVTSENIFPIIKKFLYSDHEIFLRELISNAVDATQKLKTLASVGDFKGELGDLTIRVSLDPKKKTLTVSDAGVGMTAEEIEKYINQIAFSSAEEFLEKYKKDSNAIIGHFGLGFYSSFMVSSRVEIVTRSWTEGSKAVKWSCDGSPEYSIEEIERDRRGTDVILHIDKESKEFLEEHRISDILQKYCQFLPVEIAFGKEKEWKEGKEVETDKDNIINDTRPLWTIPPSEAAEEDYKKFYRKLYPMGDDPLFNIHLNVDYPFNLTGILYFPRIKNNIEIQKNKIQLYSNQVFVTDSVEGIVPEFLTLLHGVLDSPDIPLNVSRSYLQSDSNVRKISAHITKKVADRLEEIFKNDREQFEKKWDDLKLFIEYGMMSEDKFYERAVKFALLKNTEGKYFTLEEYEKLIKPSQTDKHKTLVYLYSTNRDGQYSFIETAREKGYDVLLMDGQLDTHFLNHLESKLDNVRFARVDSEVVEKLIPKEDEKSSKLTAEQKADLTPVFQSQLPDGDHFLVSYESLGENGHPVMITQSEFMRRMKDMSELSGNSGIYGTLPDSYNLVVNENHPLIERILERADKKLGEKIKSLREQKKKLGEEQSLIDEANKGKKEEEISQADKDAREDLRKRTEALENERIDLLKNFGKSQKLVKQLIDLALLANNMLKGADLAKFVKRSVELIK
ncbi:MAG: molecular chaperone HtpG [Bacteroidales bacterium]|nr:molecular chaperone HtpG [Bacteroidales bacterium]MBN2697579.1 molecular chaperone HtpG [Bacteroidales bacterium]